MSAATGWEFTWEDAVDVGHRALNAMRLLNVKHGHTREYDTASPRLLEPPKEGPAKGRSLGPSLEKMKDDYYGYLGWGKDGRPLPETLKKLGLESVGKDLGIIK